MASLRIVNASPLILLGKIRQLSLLDEPGREVIVPDAVFNEVEDPEEVGDWPGWDNDSPAIHRADDVPIPPEVRCFAVDPGVSMVLAVALARPFAGDDVEVVIDEAKGRHAAKALGLTLVGTAGLLLHVKIDGRIALVKPLLEELSRQGMYLNQGLIRSILMIADE